MLVKVCCFEHIFHLTKCTYFRALINLIGGRESAFRDRCPNTPFESPAMTILVTCKSCREKLQFADDRVDQTAKCPKCGSDVKVSGQSVPTYDVFVSYSAKDQKVADAVVSTLEAQGVRCWIASKELKAGTTWAASLVEAIESTRIMVLVYSVRSDRSPQVLREVERAVSKGVMIIPLRIESFNMSAEMEYFLSATQWLDATKDPIKEVLADLAHLVTAIKASKLGSPLETKPRRRPVIRMAFMRMMFLLTGIVVGLLAHWWWTTPTRLQRTQQIASVIMQQTGRDPLSFDAPLVMSVVEGKIVLSAPYAVHVQVSQLLNRLAPKNTFIPTEWTNKSPGFLRLVAELEAPTELALTDISLTDAVDYLLNLHQIRIKFDTKSLDDDGVSRDHLLTLTESGVALRTLLNTICNHSGTGFGIKEESVVISSLQAAQAMHLTASYDVNSVIKK